MLGQVAGSGQPSPTTSTPLRSSLPPPVEPAVPPAPEPAAPAVPPAPPCRQRRPCRLRRPCRQRLRSRCHQRRPCRLRRRSRCRLRRPCRPRLRSRCRLRPSSATRACTRAATSVVGARILGGAGSEGHTRGQEGPSQEGSVKVHGGDSHFRAVSRSFDRSCRPGERRERMGRLDSGYSRSEPLWIASLTSGQRCPHRSINMYRH